MASSGQSAWNRNDPLTEGVVFEKRLADDIGQKWKDLGRALGFHQASIENIEQEKGNNPKECCIAVLVRWLRRDGKEGATAGNLAEALTKIGLKNLADRFPIKPSDTNRFQNDKMEETIRDICEQLINFVKENAKEDRKARELEDTVSKMKNKNKELEEEVSKMKNKNKELEEEVSRLRAINKELQDGEKQEVEVSKLRAINKESQDGEKQEVEVSKIKELEEEVSKIKELEEEPPFVVTQK
ncbi:myb-like protein X isoform X1 [Montipora capricornis]|uniref:myb-like protein X isoform X1 n=1 Tax=Montipora capricornis TaxID=246305 RepID=UPI0035F194AC